MTRAIRGLAWLLVVALAVFQAYAQRYVVGPDGVAYLDLSDAVVAGHWGGLVNLYWSPLYPLLIGLARLVTHAAPPAEVPVVHAVNALAILATFAAYEYFLTPALATAAGSRHAVLGGRWGRAAAYALFIVVAFTLTPLELTTPDLLAAAAAFGALGALVRFRRGDATPATALLLGASLGLGGLAKSFMVPWAVVCLVVLGISAARRSRTRAIAAVVVWAIIIGPWTALVSRTAGRFTFGDTGRLTYAWYVNSQGAPSLRGVPLGARRASIDSILPQAGATGDAPGTDPMWFDPERWSGGISPHFDLHDQVGSLAVSARFYVENLAPFLFLVLLVAAAPRSAWRDAWRNGWVVLVPAAAGMLGYAMVLVTARYVMPFVLAGTVILLATLPVPRRVHPLAALIGVAVPIVLESIDDRSVVALALVVSIVGGMVAGALLARADGPMDRWTGWRRTLWALGVLLASGVTHVLLPSALPGILLLGGAGLAAVFWGMSRAAIRRGRPVRFATSSSAAAVVVIGALLVLRFGGRLGQDEDARARAASAAWGNLSANIASELASHGVGPGSRIAIIGPHAESYWARTGRLKIVASVPRPVVPAFWRLTSQARDSLLQEFARAGATTAIASVGPDSGSPPPDSSWIPVRYRGWIRPLMPAGRAAPASSLR